LVITVELFGQFNIGGEKIITLHLQPPCTVIDVVIQLGLNPEEIGLIVINGVQSEMQEIVTPECRLCLFPYLSGG